MAKVDLVPDFKELFRSLNSSRVKYLLLGGYAVIYYGYARTTSDLDVWIAVDPRNAQRVSGVLQTWGGFAAADVPPTLFLKAGSLVHFGRSPAQVDILKRPSGVDFAECYKPRKVVRWDGIRVPLISLADLRINKAASARPKDLADLENLPPES